jgi:hypothetical protein
MADKADKCNICKADMIKVYIDDDHKEFVWECPACELDADDYPDKDGFEDEDKCLEDNDGGFNDDDGEHGYPDEEFLKWKNISEGRKGH